jgi:hypothetical protein
MPSTVASEALSGRRGQDGSASHRADKFHIGFVVAQCAGTRAKAGACRTHSSDFHTQCRTRVNVSQSPSDSHVWSKLLKFCLLGSSHTWQAALRRGGRAYLQPNDSPSGYKLQLPRHKVCAAHGRCHQGS